MSEKKELIMSLTKSTKNKHVYNDIGIDPVIPSVYIEKKAFPNPDSPPPQIKIIIEY